MLYVHDNMLPGCDALIFNEKTGKFDHQLIHKNRLHKRRPPDFVQDLQSPAAALCRDGVVHQSAGVVFLVQLPLVGGDAEKLAEVAREGRDRGEAALGRHQLHRDGLALQELAGLLNPDRNCGSESPQRLASSAARIGRA